MKLYNSLLAAALLVCGTLGSTATSVSAALPCNMYDPVDIELLEESGEPVPSAPRPLNEILQGDEPADREGATELTFDDGALRANVVGAGENVLRCIDYGQDRVLIDNATPNFTNSRFEAADIAIGRDLIDHGSDGSVYTGSVSNPLKLADGRFLVDFVARHDGSWISGEMVFERNRGDFYLDSSYITKTEPALSLYIVSVSEDGLTEDAITVAANTDVRLVNETDGDITLLVTSTDNDSEVFRSEISPVSHDGPTSKDIVPISEWSPGEYTATIETADGSQHFLSIAVDSQPGNSFSMRRKSMANPTFFMAVR